MAGADPRCSDDAIKHLIRLRFGEKIAAPDPSDTEAMKRFQSEGGIIVAGLSKGEWANVKRSGAVLPAGQICPAAKPYSADPNADLVNVIPEEKWSDGIQNIAAYARFLAKELMDLSLVVSVVPTTNNFAACYGTNERTGKATPKGVFHLDERACRCSSTYNLKPQGKHMERNEINDVAPTSLAHLIGQRSVVEQVRVALDAAHIDGLSFPGSLLVGPPGVGKTQTARVISRCVEKGNQTAASTAGRSGVANAGKLVSR